MNTTPPLLTDEQIDAAIGIHGFTSSATAMMVRSIARAVESATRALLLAEIERLTAEIERHQQDWSQFHHLMKKHGLHTGRTDDSLLEILDAHLKRLTAERDADRAALAAQVQAEPEFYSPEELSGLPYLHRLITALETKPATCMTADQLDALHKAAAKMLSIKRTTAAQAQAEPVAIQGYKCVSSAGAVLFTEDEAAAREMQRQGWTVIELSEAKPVAVPDGYKLVPVKPTWDMQIAASTAYREARDGHYTARMEQARDCWAAMLAAAPKG